MTRKDELYAQEQRHIADQVIRILGLDNQNSVWLGDLDNDKSRQNAILGLTNDIRRFFAFDNIPGASNPERMKRPWISIARGVTSPFYDWYRTEEQRNRKRTSRFFIVEKSSILDVRFFSGKKNLSGKYTDAYKKRTAGSRRQSSAPVQDNQEQPCGHREISHNGSEDIGGGDYRRQNSDQIDDVPEAVSDS